MITVEQLAADKRLDGAFLKRVGVHDLPGGNVGITYYDAAGNPATLRIRTALKAKEGSLWSKGATVMAYGEERLGRARETKYLVIVEGESDAWTLWQHDLPALGIPGANSTRVLNESHVRGVDRVFIVREPDKAGDLFVAGVMRRLDDAGWNGQRIPLSLAPFKDPNALHQADPGAFLAQFGEHMRRATPEPATSVTPVWPPPIPFEQHALPEFPVDALAPWARDYVEALAIATQTPVDMGAMLVLVALAVACAGKYVVKVNAEYSELLCIFAIVVLPPGERKTAVQRSVFAPLIEFERSEARRLQPEIEAKSQAKRMLEKAMERAEADYAKAAPSKQQEAHDRAVNLAKQLRDVVVPVAPRLIVEDVTPEKLATMMDEHGGRMAVVSDEGGIFELMSGRYSKNSSANLDVFLKGYSGATLRVDRMGRPPVIIDSPTLTMGLAVQPDVLHGLVRKDGFRGRGLIGRFFFSLPKSRLGRRLVDPPQPSLEVVAAYTSSLSSIVMQPLPAKPNAISLSFEARDEWVAFLKGLEPRLAEDKDLESARDWASKLTGGVLRIAGLLHVADAGYGTPAETISGDVMRRAIKIARYLTAHALIAFEEMGADTRIGDARRVLRWISKTAPSRFTQRDAFEALKGRFKRVDTLEPILKLLVQHDYLRLEPGSAVRGPGRPRSPTFIVNPTWLAENSQNSHNPGLKHQGDGSEDSANSYQRGGAHGAA